MRNPKGQVMPIRNEHYVPPDPDCNGAYLPPEQAIEIGKIVARERREANRRGKGVRKGDNNRLGRGVGGIREISSIPMSRIGRYLFG